MKNCKECTHPGRDCIPYIMTLSQEDTLAWCQARKKVLHLSNDEIAERAKVPKSTVDRVFSPKATDCRFSTMQPIVCLLAGCSAEELDCDNAEHSTETLMEQIRAKDEIIRHLEEENHRKNGVIDHLHMTAKEDIERAKEEESESIAYMKKKEKGYLRLICALSIALAVTVLIIVAGLVLDMLDPSKGFFWLRAWFGGKSGLIA